ncbi:MAG: UDP-3-O-(3-hydroxymyristoyl)glucosamine N-acyltransferase, partial [Deltaproteobacteria bacterium]|nr:UDP-3-O-(3-hydroxymyristoyl)glucosamine N-acyltransferase [Deltaproteobacteria bacterium]
MEIPLTEVAQMVGGEIIGDDSIIITGINSLDAALPGEISFFVDRRYTEGLKNTEASAVIVSEKSDLYMGCQIVVPNAGLAFATLASLFAPSLPRYPGISKQAVVHESGQLGQDVSIYPMVYVGKEAFIGDGTVLFPGVFIGDRVR